MCVDPSRWVELQEGAGTEEGEAEEERAPLVFVQDVYGAVFVPFVRVRRARRRGVSVFGAVVVVVMVKKVVGAFLGMAAAAG